MDTYMVRPPDVIGRFSVFSTDVSTARINSSRFSVAGSNSIFVPTFPSCKKTNLFLAKE